MARSLEYINKKLYSTLQANGFEPVPVRADGDDSVLPEEADLFQAVAKGGYPITVTIDREHILKLYYSKSATADSEWYDPDNILHVMRQFVRQHSLQGFDPEEQRDGKNLKYDMAKRQKMNSDEQNLNEGYYPMGKAGSYNDSIPAVKIIIKHTRQIEEGEQRFRNVAKIFIENVDGERILSPTKSPGLSKVYARLIAEGHKPYGEHWNHITGLIEDYTKLRGFVRATQNGVFNENVNKLIESATDRYSELRNTLKQLTSHRGYTGYFDNWTPMLNENSEDDSALDLTEMFKSNVVDPRIENAMPVLKKLGRGIFEQVDLVQDLKEWAGKIERDAVYGIEDDKVDEAKSPEEFMQQLTSKDWSNAMERKPINLNLSKNEWDLYSDMIGADEVADRLNQTFNLLYNGGASRQEIEAGMEDAMEKYSKFGADDTEPRSVLRFFLDKYFKDEDDDFAMREGKSLSSKQKKLDMNKNKKLDSQDFEMLRSKKKVKEAESPRVRSRVEPINKPGPVQRLSPMPTPTVRPPKKVEPVSRKPFSFKAKVTEEMMDEDMLSPTSVRKGLTKQQKKAGQVSATKRAKPTGPILGHEPKQHPFKGKLVGTDESAENPLAIIRKLSGMKK